VPDLCAVAGDLLPALPDLTAIRLQLAAVVAHVGTWMRGLSGQSSGGSDDGDGAEEERLKPGHGASPDEGWPIWIDM
jgi:hypothetical protein